MNMLEHRMKSITHQQLRLKTVMFLFMLKVSFSFKKKKKKKKKEHKKRLLRWERIIMQQLTY